MYKRLWVRIPDIFHIICCKNFNVCLKQTKNNRNEAGDDPFKQETVNGIRQALYTGSDT